MAHETWTIKKLLNVTSEYLKSKQIDNPRLAAEILLAHQLNVSRINLYLNFEQPLNSREIAGYRELIRRRVRHEPLQYITGTQEFWSLDFVVTPFVLIPRPETELLVELGMERIEKMALAPNLSPRILDLCTGCGAIAVAMAKVHPSAEIWATDISPGAIEVARLNAERHGVAERIRFMEGDLWEPFSDQGGNFDLILSNPPYVASEQYAGLPPEVREYEPRLALDGGRGGMEFIARIIRGALSHMAPGAWLMLEMAPEQTNKALALLGSVKGYREKARFKDYSHNYRVVTARKAEE